MPRQGVLGTGAPLSADVTLAIEIAMGLTLVLGMLLARRQRYRAHAWCQSAVIALNLIVIAQLMVPSFRSQVAPKIPARLARSYYTFATGHAMMGCIAELLGLYIILAAGTKLLPESLRFVRYKLWMRIALVIWWIALLLGLTTYARWYLVPKHFSSTGSRTLLGKLDSAAIEISGVAQWLVDGARDEHRQQLHRNNEEVSQHSDHSSERCARFGLTRVRRAELGVSAGADR
jgi:uncharacterized membrane protein YozB (DUF420 family)